MGELIKGPWKKRPEMVDPSKVRWRRGRPLEPDLLRDKCVDCDRPFHRKAWVPVDRVCADCRADRAADTEAAKHPTLFDDDPGGDAPA